MQENSLDGRIRFPIFISTRRKSGSPLRLSADGYPSARRLSAKGKQSRGRGRLGKHFHSLRFPPERRAALALYMHEPQKIIHRALQSGDLSPGPWSLRSRSLLSGCGFRFTGCQGVVRIGMSRPKSAHRPGLICQLDGTRVDRSLPPNDSGFVDALTLSASQEAFAQAAGSGRETRTPAWQSSGPIRGIANHGRGPGAKSRA